MKIVSSSLTVGEVLKDGKIYSVPIFQRSYSWEKQQIVDFWEDLMNLYNSKEKDDGYFIGSMVFTPHKERNKIEILDGQQRFATILLFLASLRDTLKQTSFGRAPQWVENITNLVSFSDIVTCSKNPKLELNREDRTFFDKIVIDGSIPDPKYNSHKLIREAYIFFRTEINKKVKESKENFIENILDIITNKLLVIKIEVDSDVNANMIFETLNDRGLELSVANLVKNYIFSISGQKLEEVLQLWKDVVDQVGDYNVTKFLRHFWISSFEVIGKEELYKRLKKEVKEDNVKKFMEQLSGEALVYANFNNPTHEFWGDTEIENMINKLNILRVEQVYSILLAIYNRFHNKKESFKKLLQILINFTFRYSTVCGLDPKVLESFYSKISIKLRKNKIDEEKVKEDIRKLCPSKDKFIASFEDMEIKNRKLARYVLFEMNNYLLVKNGKKELTTDINNVNLEHIIPKKPDISWKKFFEENDITKENLAHIVYKIGNMTILYKEYNKKIANKFFSVKRVMYEKSELPLNKDLKNYKVFGCEEIKKRQQEMGKIAEELWNV